MSESLRDQLLRAGFKEPEKPKRKPGKGKSDARRKPSAAVDSQAKKAASRQQQEAEAAAKRKAVKAEIRALIEANRVEKFAGEVAYRYTVGSRIKQLFVNEPMHQRIVAGELVITRLNGSTQLVPPEIAEQILKINPNWAVVRPNESSGSEDETYADFPIPDDLQW